MRCSMSPPVSSVFLFCPFFVRNIFFPLRYVHALASFRLGHTQGISTLVFVLGKSRVRCGPMSRLIDFYRARRLELLEYCDRGLRIIRQIRLIERGNTGGKEGTGVVLGESKQTTKEKQEKTRRTSTPGLAQQADVSEGRNRSKLEGKQKRQDGQDR